MRKLTQTELEPGNCWQTAVACVLDVDPQQLPTQRRFDWMLQDGAEQSVVGKNRGGSYHNALQAYLRKHHGKTYVEIDRSLWPIMQLREPGLHFVSGKTERSATNGNRSHLVIARHGEVIWDPHPSRVGLLADGERRWFALAPFPPHWASSHDQDSCQCPACGEPPAPPEKALWR